MTEEFGELKNVLDDLVNAYEQCQDLTAKLMEENRMLMDALTKMVDAAQNFTLTRDEMAPIISELNKSMGKNFIEPVDEKAKFDKLKKGEDWEEDA